MNKVIKRIALLGMLLMAPQSFANLITNSDFANSCSLNNWDQFGDISISGSTPHCAANLTVNDDPNYIADLSQGITLAANTDYSLFVNFNVNTTNNNSIFDDVFIINLFNDDKEFIELFKWGITTAASFSELLTINSNDLASHSNQNWSLSFYLADEYFNHDTNISTVSINNALLVEAVTDVPEPSSLAIFALGFVGLMSRKKLIRKSTKNNRDIICR